MMRRVFGAAPALLVYFQAEAARAADSVGITFTGGNTAASEAFGDIEGPLLFAAAVLGIAAIYAMIFFGRRVHLCLKDEFRAVEDELKEKRS